MKVKVCFLTSAVILTALLPGCVTEECPYVSAPVSIRPPANILSENSSSLLPTWSLHYNPMLLPFKIVFNKKNGFYLDHSEDSQEIITPIGNFGLSLDLSSPGTRSKLNINEGDFLVILTNRRTETKQLFKIEGHNKLQVIVNGRSKLNFSPGYAEIDVTESRIENISFSDIENSYIENPSESEIKIGIMIGSKDYPGEYDIYNIALPAQSYVVFKKGLTPSPDSNFVAAIDRSSINQSSAPMSAVQKRLVGGNTYLVYLDRKDQSHVGIRVIDNFPSKGQGY